jgi:DNA-directed RNA polymerase specialized sigma24 family protein
MSARTRVLTAEQRLYVLESTESATSLGKEFGVSQQAISYIRKRIPKYNETVAEKLAAAYLSGKSARKIGEEFEMHHATVSILLKRAKVELRNPGPPRTHPNNPKFYADAEPWLEDDPEELDYQEDNMMAHEASLAAVGRVYEDA